VYDVTATSTLWTVKPSRVPNGCALEEDIVSRHVAWSQVKLIPVVCHEGMCAWRGDVLFYPFSELFSRCGLSTQQSGRFNPGKESQSLLYGRLKFEVQGVYFILSWIPAALSNMNSLNLNLPLPSYLPPLAHYAMFLRSHTFNTLRAGDADLRF